MMRKWTKTTAMAELAGDLALITLAFGGSLAMVVYIAGNTAYKFFFI